MPQSTEPLDDLYYVQLPWAEGSSASINGTHWTSYFSAVCWMNAKYVFINNLKSQVPIGNSYL